MLTRPTNPISDSLRNRAAIFLLGIFGHLTAPIKNRGFSRAATFVAKYVASDMADANIQLSEDTPLTISLKDPYWSRLVSTGYQYEPELHSLFHALRSIDYVFLDCGANKGYWTVLVSGKEMGSKEVIAVEPLPDTFECLRRNVASASRNVTLLQNAISFESGKRVNLYFHGDHSGSTLEPDWNHSTNTQTDVFEVETRSIDDVLACALDHKTHLVIKIDIEGHELASLRGATRTLTHMPLIIYEEHGGTPNADLTNFVGESLGMEVFFLEDDGTPVAIRSAAEVIQRKRNPQKGYNCCACSRKSVFYPFLVSGGK